MASERDALLDAATKLFLSKEFKSVTVEELQEASGLSKAAFLRQASSKEEVLHAVLARDVQQLIDAVRPGVRRGRKIADILEGVAAKAFEYIDSHPLMMTLMTGTIEVAVPDWAPRFEELRQRCLAVPVEALKVGVSQSEIRDDLPLDLVAALMFELQMSGFLLHHKQGKDRAFKAAQRRKAGIELLLNGLRPR